MFDSEFIDIDTDRFALRVAGLPENAGPFSIDLSTENDGASVWDDGPNEVLLYEQSSGIYTSKTMILVSNEIDDNETHDGSDGALSGVSDNAVGDRTHKVMVGGTVHAALQFAGHTCETTAEVPLDGTVYLTMVVPLKENGKPMIDNSYVLEHIRVMKETFAQTGLKTHAYITHIDIPSNVDLDDGLIIFDQDDDGTNWVDQETRNLVDEGGTVPDTSDIHIFYVKEMFVNHFRESIDRPCAGMQIRPGNNIATSHLGYTYNAFISIEDSQTPSLFLPFCPAHEMVHLLSDDGSHYVDKPWNLMDGVAVCFDADDISNPKRLDGTQEEAIKTDTDHIIE